ncbi:hypothetical protein B0H66DRAFT_591644, partial [Apodospora peruviana]
MRHDTSYMSGARGSPPPRPSKRVRFDLDPEVQTIIADSPPNFVEPTRPPRSNFSSRRDPSPSRDYRTTSWPYPSNSRSPSYYAGTYGSGRRISDVFREDDQRPNYRPARTIEYVPSSVRPSSSWSSFWSPSSRADTTIPLYDDWRRYEYSRPPYSRINSLTDSYYDPGRPRLSYRELLAIMMMGITAARYLTDILIWAGLLDKSFPLSWSPIMLVAETVLWLILTWEFLKLVGCVDNLSLIHAGQEMGDNNGKD